MHRLITVVVDECYYEDNLPHFWGSISEREMLQQIPLDYTYSVTSMLRLGDERKAYLASEYTFQGRCKEDTCPCSKVNRLILKNNKITQKRRNLIKIRTRKRKQE